MILDNKFFSREWTMKNVFGLTDIEYDVVCDETNNTDESIARGELKVDFAPRYDMTYVGSPYKIEYKLVEPPDSEKHKFNTDVKRLSDKIYKAIEEAFAMPLWSQEPMNPNHYVSKDDYTSAIFRIEQLERQNKALKEDGRKLIKRNNELKEKITELYGKLIGMTPTVPVKNRPPFPVMNSSPHASWHSIVDNENDVTR